MNTGLNNSELDNFKLPPNDVSIISKISDWEKLVEQYPQVALKVFHYFSKGVYARELHIPKGVILTGHIHKYENLNILSKGKMEVLVGEEMQVIEAPFTVVSPPGTKRIARALEDCVWTTIHGTDETNLNIIERTFIAKDMQEYLDFTIDKQLKLI